MQARCSRVPLLRAVLRLTTGDSPHGMGVPGDMGAKLACRIARWWRCWGRGFHDGDAELSTMAQYDIPVVVVLADNCGWMAIKDLQIDALGADHAFGNDFERDGTVYSPDFVKIAEAFGIGAERITRVEEAAGAIDRAIRSGKPALIHAQVCREYPYSGGKAFGWWMCPSRPITGNAAPPTRLPKRKKQSERVDKGGTIMPDTLRVVLVGCGRIATLHTWGYKDNPHAVIYGVYDKNPKRAQSFAKEYGIERVYASYEEVLNDPNVDAVELLVPHHLHCEMTIAACQAKKHVSVQKPMALNLSECDAMIAAAKEHGVKLKVFENFVFYPYSSKRCWMPGRSEPYRSVHEQIGGLCSANTPGGRRSPMTTGTN